MPQHDLLKSVRRFWQHSYAADYLALTLLLTADLLLQAFVTPFHRMFSLSNLAIQFPHAVVERVPVPHLIIYAAVLPFLAIISYSLLFFRNQKNGSGSGFHRAHVSLLGLALSLLLTLFLTDIAKNAVGRPRPDLLARCKPQTGTDTVGLVGWEVCGETEQHLLQDGWRSFPSGHSSWAFSGLGYLSLFLAGQLHVLRPNADMARVLVSLAPLVGATLIAISRCEDYRHDVYDVTIGSFLGMGVAHLVYRKFFLGLRSSRCDVPYERMGSASNGSVFAKSRDEEDGGGDSDGERIPLQDTRGRS